MLQIGTYHTLKIARDTKVGLFLVNENEEVLLPKKYVPADFHIGDDITVFVYLDHEERGDQFHPLAYERILLNLFQESTNNASLNVTK